MNLKLTDDWDLDFTGGNITMLSGVEEIRQKAKIRLQFFKGEWFLDQRVGLPYFQEILEKGTSLTVVSNRLRTAVETTPGIASITYWKADYDGITRSLSVEFEANLLDDLGTLSFDEVFVL